VFLNLLVNAAHAIQDKGIITLTTGQADESVWIEIGDNGCGMPADVQKRIFEPFFTTKPVGKGTGLGLSISWEIIKRHQGTIEVESTSGAGTTFRISLPIKAAS
jgi:signal transduction histidine kinase